MAKARQTRIEMVRAMLDAPEGASLDALCTATGWQAHSARAALSRLRKAGYTIDRQPAGTGNDKPSFYRITATPGAAQ